jgi:hypothetical protein
MVIAVSTSVDAPSNGFKPEDLLKMGIKGSLEIRRKPVPQRGLVSLISS